MIFEPDKKISNSFGAYVSNTGRRHDAGYDAYMTGIVFANLSKFIEIGNIVNKPPTS